MTIKHFQDLHLLLMKSSLFVFIYLSSSVSCQKKMKKWEDTFTKKNSSCLLVMSVWGFCFLFFWGGGRGEGEPCFAEMIFFHSYMYHALFTAAYPMSLSFSGPFLLVLLSNAMVAEVETLHAVIISSLHRTIPLSTILNTLHPLINLNMNLSYPHPHPHPHPHPNSIMKHHITLTHPLNIMNLHTTPNRKTIHPHPLLTAGQQRRLKVFKMFQQLNM